MLRTALEAIAPRRNHLIFSLRVKRDRWLRLRVLLGAFLFSTLEACVFGRPPSATSIQIPIYHHQELAAVVRVELLTTEQPRIGPFRVAGRGYLLAHKLEIELVKQDPELVDIAVAALEQRCAGTGSSKPVLKVKQAKIRWKAGNLSSEILKFETAQPSQRKGWRLTGVEWTSQGRLHSAKEASLIFTDPKCPLLLVNGEAFPLNISSAEQPKTN